MPNVQSSRRSRSRCSRLLGCSASNQSVTNECSGFWYPPDSRPPAETRLPGREAQVDAESALRSELVGARGMQFAASFLEGRVML
jgi:hypothetical protein